MHSLFLCVSFAVAALAQSPAPPKPAVAKPARTNPLASMSRSLERLADRVKPAVVQIMVQALAPSENNVPGFVTTENSSGSGVIVDPEGYIITNAHVVNGGRRIEVTLSAMLPDGYPGRSILRPRGKTVQARVIGTDRQTDLAVLKIQETGLPVLRFGNSDRVKQGQLVVAMGSPLGLENSLSLGVISALARQVEPDDPMIYLQTDAPINPGNSGGPLLDIEGRIIGINTFILSQSGGSEGLGFAAPGNIVRNVYGQIRAKGRVRRGQIGISGQTITRPLSQGLGLDRDWGVIVADVLEGGSGAAAGIEPGDIVVTLDGKPMENARQLDVNIFHRAMGDTVTLEILRGGKPLQVRVTVLDDPGDPGRLGDLVTEERNLVRRLGVLAVTLDEKVAPFMSPPRRLSGAVVAAVPAQYALRSRGLEAGDVIYSVNRTPVRSLEELQKVVAAVPQGTPLALQVERSGRLTYLVIGAD